MALFSSAVKKRSIIQWILILIKRILGLSAVDVDAWAYGILTWHKKFFFVAIVLPRTKYFDQAKLLQFFY